MFLDLVVFICDFHRSRTWERWLSNKENGYADDLKGDMICKPRRIAVSMTGEE